MKTERLAILLALTLAAAACRTAAAEPAHPLKPLLEQAQTDLDNDPSSDPWATGNERLLAELSMAPAAKSAGARDFLWRELRAGRTFAAAPLWDVYRDTSAVDFLTARLSRPRAGSSRPLDVPFVLGYLRSPRSVPALWRVIETSKEDPFLRIFCARAIYRIDGDSKAAAFIKDLAAQPHPEYEKAETNFTEMAGLILEDIKGSGPAPDGGK